LQTLPWHNGAIDYRETRHGVQC